jgi:hypothetical protein
MAKLTAEDKAKFRAYVADAARSADNLVFLLDNLGTRVPMDYSVESLAAAEGVFWRCVREGVPKELEDLIDLEHFAQLLGQYLGQCVIRTAGGAWVQSEDQNPMFGQPCVDGFGNKPWERVYPVSMALHLRRLPEVKPDFPGVREQRVAATHLEKALSAHRRAQAATGGQR